MQGRVKNMGSIKRKYFQSVEPVYQDLYIKSNKVSFIARKLLSVQMNCLFSGVSQGNVWLWVNCQKQWMEAGDSGRPGPTAPGPVQREYSQRSENATTPSELWDWRHITKQIRAVFSWWQLFVFTDRSLGGSTAQGNASVTERVTQNPVTRISQHFERCSAASLTLCLITTNCTSGFRYRIHVSFQSLQINTSSNLYIFLLLWNFYRQLQIMANRCQYSPWKTLFTHLWYFHSLGQFFLIMLLFRLCVRANLFLFLIKKKEMDLNQ